MRNLRTAIELESANFMCTDPIGSPSDMLDHLPVLALTIDMQSHEIRYANRHTQKTFGNVVGKTCWQALQKDQVGPCPFCSDKQLVDPNGLPTVSYRRQVKNTLTQRWYDITDSAAIDKDGRVVKMSIAIDITDPCQSRPSFSQGCASDCTDSGATAIMCARCHKIRGQKGGWESPAHYLKEKLGILVSHGICRKCAKILYPWLEIDEDEERLEN
jgi:hypothetical protein